MIAEELPDWLDKEAWEAFIDMRKRKGKSYPFTPLAQKRILQKLAVFHALGQNTSDIIWKSHDRGWSDVFAQPVIAPPTINPVAATPEYVKSNDWLKQHDANMKAENSADVVKAALEKMKAARRSFGSKA